jgi:hypothetical protein
MATAEKTEMTEAELLHFYLGLRLQNGDRGLSVEQIMTDFSEYLRQRNIMRAMIRDADEAIAAGSSGPLDLERTIEEVVQDLAAEGITE